MGRIILGILVGAFPFVAWHFWCAWWSEWATGWGQYWVCNWCQMPFRTDEESDKHKCILRWLSDAFAVLYIIVRHPILAVKWPFQVYAARKKRGRGAA